MKLILAIIRIAKMGDTKQALADAGLPSFTAMPVLGRGKGHGDLEKIKEAESAHEALEFIPEVPRLKSKRMITLVVTDEKKDLAVETIINTNHTGKSGDGKIFVINALGSYSVHTGESGDATLD
ncbi:P-II family nitrogen regulator [Bacteroidia bacterium]|nr:P-II family nitrogen regulator [Bacteroidia bacterium]GHV31367.1 P-II family nitrogen regulator [Bacteroidia bacterium]